MSCPHNIEEQVARLETRSLEITLTRYILIEDEELAEVWRDAQELAKLMANYPQSNRLRTRLEGTMAELHGLGARLQTKSFVRSAA
jgi:hypothetical protein